LLIVVEGMDCTRKSTLVAQLAEEIQRRYPGDQVDVWHAGPPTKHPLDEYVTPLLDYRPRRNRHVICDRWHLGESIYPFYLGRESKFDAATQAYVDLFLRSRGALLVHVDAQPDDVQTCMESRGDDLVDPKHALGILLDYRARAAVCHVPTLVVQGFEANSETASEVLRQANALDFVYQHLSNYTTYVGTITPRTLLLGDVRHGHIRGDATDLRPAFLPYGATSGHYLLAQAVATFGFGVLRHVGIANACDDDDHENLWTVLRKPHTVVLGRQAQRRTPWANTVVQHPQFRRRFHYAEGSEYARQIFDPS